MKGSVLIGMLLAASLTDLAMSLADTTTFAVSQTAETATLPSQTAGKSTLPSQTAGKSTLPSETAETATLPSQTAGPTPSVTPAVLASSSPMTTSWDKKNNTTGDNNTATAQPPTMGCPRGRWGMYCQKKCNCNDQRCNQTSGACMCGPCFKGPACNETSEGGRQCVKDLFTARKSSDVQQVLSNQGKPPRDLPQPDRVALFADFAKTSVNNIGETTYKVIPKKGGKELIQLKAVIPDRVSRAAVCDTVKEGNLGATCIEHSDEATIYLNKPAQTAT